MINRDPDARLFIRHNSEFGLGKLTFQLLLRDPALGPLSEEFGPTPLQLDTSSFLAELECALGHVRVLANQGRVEEAQRRLSSIGTTFFRQLPSELQKRFWSILGRAKTLQIISDEPKLPWELMKLQERNAREWNGGPFLCEAFAVTRWLHKMTGSVELPVRNIALVVPGNSRLSELALEREGILSLAGSGRRVLEITPPSHDAVTKALRSGEHDAWHFCGHGTAIAIDPNRMTFDLLKSEQPLRPEDVNEYGESLSRCHPLVFLNACETGKSGFSLISLGGWAHAFLDAGAGAFLGTLWPVSDSAAKILAQDFYRRFLGGEHIAEALRQSRLYVRETLPGDPSWLAYVAFAHPFASVQAKRADSRSVQQKTRKPSAKKSLEPFAFEHTSTPPDLVIQTQTIFRAGKTCLEFSLSSPSGAIELKTQKFTGASIAGSPEEYRAHLDRLITRIEKFNNGLDIDGERLLMSEIKAKLDGIGRDLYYELFPLGMRQAYRNFRRQRPSLMFITDEPWIPWELVKPYDDSDMGDVIDDDFLCLKFPMTRWLSAAAPPVEEVQVRRFALLGSTGFPRSEKERARIAEFAGKHSGIEDVSPGETTVTALENLLDGSSAELLHFAGPLVGRTFRPEDLHGPRSTKIRNNRPFVFFNFGELAGWERRWIKDCGCGAFLGPLWKPRDSLAYEFAVTLYDSLARGETFGCAIQEARQRIYALKPGAPTWLAYTIYAHVNGRLVLGDSLLE